jgi:hypothetical protein
MLEKPCPYHRTTVKHTLKECDMMKRYFSKGVLAKGDQDKKPEGSKEDDRGKDDAFPIINNCFMIFGGLTSYDSKRQCKLERREVYATEPAMPTFLNWSDSAITFDHKDHSDRVLWLGQYPLVVDPIISNTWLTKVLMNGGSDLNIMYAETLNAMGISRARLHQNTAPLHGIMPGKQHLPPEQIDLPVTFGDPSNFRKETLTFKVVGFCDTYHAVLGRPWYAQFMAILNYTYLKLKMAEWGHHRRCLIPTRLRMRRRMLRVH